MKTPSGPNPGHEASDASLRLIGILAASLALGVGAVLLTVHGILASDDSGPRLAPGLGKRGGLQNGPQERTSIEASWAEIAEETQRHLHTYGWVDRPAGMVRIPIERAMSLLLSRAESAARKEKTDRQP